MIENQHTEFKQIWKDDYLKSICAFANAQGGKLLIGINNKGLTVLFKKENKSFEELSAIGLQDVEKDVEKLSRSEKLIFEQIKINSKITAKELSELIGINTRNVQKNIQQLKNKKFIERIGPDKGGFWKICK